MAKTRGGLSASPSSPTPRPHRAAMGGAASPPVQAPTIPHLRGALLSADTPPGGHPRTCTTSRSSRELASRPQENQVLGSGEPSHAPQPEPPTEDSRILVDIPPETVIRRPMIAGPPIEAYFAPEGAPAVPAPPELPRDDQLPQAQQDEILTETTPPAPAAHTSGHMPEAIHPTTPLTQGAPSVMPATPAPPPSSEPTVAIQQHLSMQTPLGHDRSAPSEPLVPDEESLPAEQPIPEEEIRAEPSHDPTHI
ncbi:hypothetical protein AAG906_035786 [Vitis piasezkii]